MSDETISIDQKELEAYLKQMKVCQREMDGVETNQAEREFIPCSYDKYAKLQTRKERRKALVDGEDKDETRERKMMQKAAADPLYDEVQGALGGGHFVVTGVYEHITREKLEKFIKTNGGHLQTGVSTKTNYLIVGHILDDNRPVTDGAKYKKAVALGKKIMTEKEFELFCKQRFRNPDFRLGRDRAKDLTEGSFDYFANEKNDAKADDLEGIDDITELLAKRQA